MSKIFLSPKLYLFDPTQLNFLYTHGGSMDIFGMGTRHGLSSFEQIAVMGVVVTAFL